MIPRVIRMLIKTFRVNMKKYTRPHPLKTEIPIWLEDFIKSNYWHKKSFEVRGVVCGNTTNWFDAIGTKCSNEIGTIKGRMRCRVCNGNNEGEENPSRQKICTVGLYPLLFLFLLLFLFFLLFLRALFPQGTPLVCRDSFRARGIWNMSPLIALFG